MKEVYIRYSHKEKLAFVLSIQLEVSFEVQLAENANLLIQISQMNV